MWNAVISEWQVGSNSLQNGYDSGAIVVGADIGGDAVNTVNTLVLNPAQIITPGDWLGRHVIMAGGTLDRLGDTISEEIIQSGTTLVAVRLSHAFPSAPSAGMKFHLFEPLQATATPVRSVQRSFQISKEISEVVFETDIRIGFARASVQLNDRANYLGKLYGELPGRYIEIFDNHGTLCYAGLIYGVNISGFGGSIECMSLRDTLSWVPATDILYDGISNTQALRFTVQLNPWLNYSLYAIDPLNTWHTASLSKGGVGKRDYTDGDLTLQDIIEDILSMGYYGMNPPPASPNNTDHVNLQVWEEGIPVLRVRPRFPSIDDVDYHIGNKNFNYRLGGADFSADMVDLYSTMYTSYTDDNGLTQRTVAAYTPYYFDKFGMKNKLYDSGASSKEDAIGSLFAAKLDREIIGGPGSITIHGQVKSKFGYHNVPSHLIRAGDIVALEDLLDQAHSGLLYNRDVLSGIFIVGSTSYNSSSNQITLTAHKPTPYHELYNNRLGDI